MFVISDPFALEVLREFTTLFDFTNKTFDESLRHYLNSFRLPGEAQKIDRSILILLHYTNCKH